MFSSYQQKELIGTLTTASVPNMKIGDDLNSGTVGRLGNRSMMIENVNHRLANANHENTKEKTLYCGAILSKRDTSSKWNITHNCLDVEEEHTNDAVTGFVQTEEVHKSIDRCSE